MSKKRTVIIRYERLEYVPKYIEVDEEESNTIYDRLKEERRTGKIRNLRRL